MRIVRTALLLSIAPILALSLILGAAPAAAQDDGPMKWVVLLTGDQERPTPSGSDAIGTALVTFDPSDFGVDISINVFGLTRDELFDIPSAGPLHLHVREAGQDNGGIAVTFGMSSDWMEGVGGIALMAEGAYAGGFTGEQVMDAMVAGLTYLNLHTETNMSGEIRGDLAGKMVPEPALGILLLLGGIALRRRADR